MRFIKEFNVLAGLLLAATAASSAPAQLVVYNFNSTAAPWAPSTVESGVTAGTMTPTPPYSWVWSVTTSPGDVQVNPGTGVNTAAEAIAAPMYLAFTLSSATPLDLSSLTLDGGYGSFSSPAGYAVESSVDGYSSILSTANFTTQAPTYSTYAVDLSGASFQGLTSVTFRIYAYTGNYGYEQFDNITVNGILAPVPEPGSLALAGIGLAAWLAAWIAPRRKS